MARVLVVGAGMVGAACAYFLARDGHEVTVVDRGPVGAGTTSRGEGNILVSDKSAGPELALALRSAELWRRIAERLGANALEWESKGGLVVATTDETLGALREFATLQAAAGVSCGPIEPGNLSSYEPNLAPGLPGGVFYPGDQQVQPVRAAAALLYAARVDGATVRHGVEVLGVRTRSDGRVRSVECRVGDAAVEIDADAVVNATGTWGGDVSARIGAPVPVLPRRGFILVTEPLPHVVRHKVYTADYVSNVASGAAGLETSVVVEGTRGGTVLIGASRERVGFDTAISYPVLRTMAAQAVRIFPFLDRVSLLRVYTGFRPYCPDHLPVIGADPRIAGIYHACGHEGAGIGLAPATGEMIADLVSDRSTFVPAEPFSPARFVSEAA